MLLTWICAVLASVLLAPASKAQEGLCEEKLSDNPRDWYYEKKIERRVKDGSTVVVQSFVFKRDKKELPCIAPGCPYQYPAFDERVESVNNVLKFLGLPEVQDLIKNKITYTTSKYPAGRLEVHTGGECDYIWKITVAEQP
jgi:hypothetical protein